MPIARFQLPDGRVARYEVPEGTTPEQAQAMITGAQGKPLESSLEEQRKLVADGITLSPFGYDTGIEMPQGVTEFLAGAGKRLSEIGTLGTHEADQTTESLLNDSGYAAAGGAVADIAAMTAGGSALKAANVIKAAPTALQTILGGAAYGGATTKDRATGATAGGVGAGIGYGAAQGLGKLIAPKVTQGAQKLIDDGGVATPGQILGGIAKNVEDKATAIPLVGYQVAKAQRASIAQWSKGVVNDSLKPIGRKLDKATKPGADSIKEAQDIVSRRYDTILGKAKVARDAVFDADLNSIRGVAQSLPKQEAKEFDNLIERYLGTAFRDKNGVLSGKEFKEADSALRAAYKKLQKSPDYYQSKLGDSMRDVHGALRNMLNRQDTLRGKALDNADLAYAKLSRVEDAAKYAGAEDRVFGPAHLLSAIKNKTTSKRFAAGEGFDQKATEAAKAVLPNTVPDSGTTGRALLSGGVLAGGAVVDPTLAAGMLMGTGAYTQPGLRALQALLTKRPGGAQAARGMLEGLSPLAGAGGSGYALNSDK